MKKKIFFALMAIAAMFMTVGFTACSSDDDDNTPETPKVTSVDVDCRFGFLRNPDLTNIFNFSFIDQDGKKESITHNGKIVQYALPTTAWTITGSDGKKVLVRCYYMSFNHKTITSFPATYSFTVNAEIWVNLDEADEADIYDYFAIPYFKVKTNLDEKEKSVAGDPVYNYVQKVDYRKVKTDAALRAKIEGKYICTLNIDKDGNCTASWKLEQLDANQK